MTSLANKAHEHKRSRFAVSTWMNKLIPALLAIIALGLIATLVITGLAILGVTPGM